MHPVDILYSRSREESLMPRCYSMYPLSWMLGNDAPVDLKDLVDPD